MRILAHLADLLCFCRIIFSIAVLIVGPNPVAPWLFGFALLTDLFDGWCFRHFSKRSSYWTPWNPFMASTDQLADLVFVLCGVFYAGSHGFGLTIIELLIIDLGILGSAWALSVIPDNTPNHYRQVYTFCATFLTHSAAFLMVASAVAVWHINRPDDWLPYAITNVALYYLLFLFIGDKSRLIRRPNVRY